MTIKTFVQGIETDLEAAWGTVEGAVETAAETVWADFKPTFAAFLPEEYAIVKTLITGVLQGAGDRSVEEIETALLNAGTDEVALIKKVGSATIQALIAVVKAA